MAGQGVNIGIDGDSRGFNEAVREAGKDLDHLSEDLADLARDTDRSADRAGKSLEQGYSKGAREAADELEQRIKRGIDEAAERTRKKSKQAGDDLGDAFHRGAKRAEEGLEELQDEATSTLKESAASFDGTVESAVDAVQEIAANAFAGFGPAGLAAGALAAVGIGLAISELEKYSELANAAQERTSELTEEMYAAGGALDQANLADKIVSWSSEIKDNKEWWEVWQSEATSNLEYAQQSADRAGVSFETMLKGLSGYDSEAAKESIEAVSAKIEELEQLRASENSVVSPYTDQIRQLTELKTALEQASGVMPEATEGSQALQEALDSMADTAEKAAAKQSLLDDISSELTEIIGDWQEYADAESGALDAASYLDGINSRTQALEDYAANLETIKDQISPEAFQAVLDQGIDFAPMLQSIIDSGLVEEMDSTFTDAANAAQGSIDSIDGTVKIDADTDDAEDGVRTVQGAAAKPVTTPIHGNTGNAASVYDAFKSNVQGNPLTSTVNANTAGAESHIAQRLPQHRTQDLRVDVDDSGAWSILEQLTQPRTVTIIADVVQQIGRSLRI